MLQASIGGAGNTLYLLKLRGIIVYTVQSQVFDKHRLNTVGYIFLLICPNCKYQLKFQIKYKLNVNVILSKISLFIGLPKSCILG